MTKNGKKNQRLRRIFFHWVVKQLCLNIEEYRNGFFFKFKDGTTRLMIPVLAYVITDWPEGQAMALIGAGNRG